MSSDNMSNGKDMSAQQSGQENSQPDQSREDQPSTPPEKPNGSSVVVRYGLMRQLGEFRHNLEKLPAPGTRIVARTERGVELGEVVISISPTRQPRCITSDQLKNFLRENGEDYPFRKNGKILRIANHQDVIDFRHLQTSARDAANFCREQIRDIGLPMKIVTVEHLLGGGRLIFYFSADSRVDFRDLVKRLAGEYHTRIEMRQVGARDEARLVGDYERCGRQCCCKQYLKFLKPISMRMAKTQKATLDPSKISGRCGRLMCCLRYEDAGYEELRRKLPRRNTWVRTAEFLGRVVDTQIITQLVRIETREKTHRVVSNEDIIERNIQENDLGPETQAPQEQPRKRPQSQPARNVVEEKPATAATVDEARKSGQRRRRKNIYSPEVQQEKVTPDQQPSQQEQAKISDKAEHLKKKKHRRRHRKKKK